MRGLIGLGLLFGFASAAFAGPADPCRKIRLACEVAGRKPPMACVRSIISGTEISGVGVHAADVEACRAKKDKRGAKKARQEVLETRSVE